MVVLEEEDNNQGNDELFLQLRNKFLQELDNSTNTYEPEDIERVRTDDHYCKRFLLHKKGNFDNAYSMMKEALAWRKTFGVKTCTEDSIPSEFFEARAAFPYNTDKNGNPIILLLIRFHKRNPEYAKDMRRFVIYWVEKMEEESGGGQMTVIMNCVDAGLSNLDLDLIKFLITLFRSYYPHSLAHILIYEMPWIFNAAWKIIKQWLPEDFVEKIVFVNKTSIQNFINEESLPVDMGGTCTLQYEPPILDRDVNSNSITENSETERKRVRFSQNGLVKNDGSLTDLNGPYPGRKSSHDRNHLLMTDDYCVLAGILKISPAQSLVFYPPAAGENSEVSIKLTCVSDKKVTFKVKTNNIENYRVKPSIGIIEPNSSIDISVYLVQGHHPQASDKFLIMAMQVPDSSATMPSLSHLWRTSSPDQMADHKLKCVVGVLENMRGDKHEMKLNDTLKGITSALESLNTKVQHLQASQQVVVRNQRFTLALLVFWGVLFCSYILCSHFDDFGLAAFNL